MHIYLAKTLSISRFQQALYESSTKMYKNKNRQKKKKNKRRELKKNYAASLMDIYAEGKKKMTTKTTLHLDQSWRDGTYQVVKKYGEDFFLVHSAQLSYQSISLHNNQTKQLSNCL